MKVEDRQILERAEKMMVRWMCGVTLKNRITSEELRNRMSIEAVTEIVRRGRLRWFGHVERKVDDDWVKKCTKVEVVGKVGRGRGRKTWLQCVNSDMKDLGLRVGEPRTGSCGEGRFLVKRLSRACMEKQTLNIDDDDDDDLLAMAEA